MIAYEEQITEVKVGNILFQVISHFQKEGRETIDSKLIKLMEDEQKNLIDKANS